MLLSEAFLAYSRDVIAFRNQSFKTEENHFVAYRSLLAFCGDINIEQLNFHQVRDWKLYLDETRSAATVRNYILKLRVVLGYCASRGLAVLPLERVPVPKRPETLPSFLNAAQVQLCIDATKRLKNKAIVALLYSAGIRISELCALNRGCFHDGLFSVIGKGGKARLCFIDKRAESLLLQYEQTRTDNELALFLSDAGRRITPSAVQDTFKTIRKQTGLSVHPHTLRHSFATNLLTNNTNLYHVSKMLGHQQLNTTELYLHVIDKDLEAVYREKHTI